MYIHIWSAYVYTHICMYTNICTYLHNLYIYHICISCMHEVARKRAAFNKSKPGSLELVNPLVSTPGRGFTGTYV